MVKLEFGNPAPLGALASAVTLACYAYVDMGWAEADFIELVWSHAVWLGGFTLLMVGFLLILQGETFGGTVYATFACFWLGWAYMWKEYKDGVFHGLDSFKKGQVLWYATFGVVTLGFFPIAFRKNVSTIILFLFYLLGFIVVPFGIYHEGVKKLGGYIYLGTAICSAYIGIARLLAEEFGRFILPGLQPLHSPDKTLDSVVLEKRIAFDGKSNTLLIDFRDLEITSETDVGAIDTAVRKKCVSGRQVAVVENYYGFSVDPQLQKCFQSMLERLHKDCFVSVSCFHADLLFLEALSSV